MNCSKGLYSYPSSAPIMQATARSVGGFSAFLLGAAAAAVAIILTYPLQIAQAKAWVGKVVKGVQKKKKGLLNIFFYISWVK